MSSIQRSTRPPELIFAEQIVQSGDDLLQQEICNLLALCFCQDFFEEPVIDQLGYRNLALEFCLFADLPDLGLHGILRDRPISRENLDDLSQGERRSLAVKFELIHQ